MKKLLVIAACIITHYISFAQDGAVGVYVGANFPNMDMQNPELTSDNKAGYQAGVFYRKGEVLYGQVGLEYQMMKSNFHFQDTSDILKEDDVIFRSINLPLYIGANLLPITDNLVNLRIYAGPTVSYLFDVPLNELEFTTDDFNRIRVNGGLGAGLDIMIFSVDVAYNFGVNQLFTDEFDGKTNYATVNIGLHF
ncbi:MAG: PorT family protein [Fimbriimonadaceae bacterium]|nr:PorT family protein [Chitinophagales bacterium]